MKNRPGVAPICISQKSHASLKAHDAPEQPQAAPQLHAVALLEAINASAGVYQLLLASKERMALGADIDAKLRLRGTRLERVTATANYRSFIVLRMNTLLHIYTPHFPPRNWEWIQAHYARAWFRPSSPSSGESQSILAWKQTSLRPLPVYYITEPTRLQGSSAKILLKKTAR